MPFRFLFPSFYVLVEDSVSDVNSVRQSAQIRLQNNFFSLPAERQSVAVEALAAVLKISPESIQVHDLHGNRVGFNVKMSGEAVEDLDALLQANSGSLRLLGVEQVILEKNTGSIEAWMIKDGKFHLAALTASPPSATTPDAASPRKQQRTFEPVPRIWLFHLIYLFVTITLAASIVRYSQLVSVSLLLIAGVCALGILLVRFRRLMAAHILAVAIGLGAPVVVFGRLWPNQTVILFFFLVLGVFIARKSLF